MNLARRPITRQADYLFKGEGCGGQNKLFPTKKIMRRTEESFPISQSGGVQMIRIRYAFAVASVAGAFPAITLAQESTEGTAGTNALEPIVITATRRSQFVQDVPQTINAFPQNTITGIGGQAFSE